MFVDFFYHLRDAGVPLSTREFLSFLEAMQHRVISPDVDEFYYLARTTLVKDERFFDPFDKAFAHYFKGAEKFVAQALKEIPEEWLRSSLERAFSQEELEKIKSLGGLEALLETFKERLEEQDEAHHGGSKWIGTGGTSPFGSGGTHPEGVRVGEQGQRREKAAKVWEQREYAPLAKDMTLNTRNIKLALKRLRLFTREGAQDELNLEGTIRRAARNGAMWEILMRPSRKNRIKVLLFFDIGGSMSPHVRRCEQLFSSARTEFKQLETFYFHNCIYENVWRDEHRYDRKVKTFELLHKFNRDYRVVIVGDAAMSPYELVQSGGSVDHFNEEPGIVWLQRLREAFPHNVWLNPEPQGDWGHVESSRMIRTLFEGRMYPLTLAGLVEAMDLLRRRSASHAVRL